jgi:hypothetical protein
MTNGLLYTYNGGLRTIIQLLYVLHNTNHRWASLLSQVTVSSLPLQNRQSLHCYSYRGIKQLSPLHHYCYRRIPKICTGYFVTVTNGK